MKGGQLIRTARRRAGLSQSELARRIGRRQPVIARWEMGDTAPTFDSVMQALKACGFDPSVELSALDDSDDRAIALMRRKSPRERLAANRSLLRTEAWAQRAKRVNRAPRA